MPSTASPIRPRSALVVGITPAELTHDPDSLPLSEVWYSSANGMVAHRRSPRTTPPPIPQNLELAGNQLTWCADLSGTYRSVTTWPASNATPRCTDCR